MIIRTLRLKNYCQHENRTVTFSPYLNLLVGPNGSGKSNIIRALLLCLTGESIGAGVKADDICQAAGNDEHSYVELDFEHDGKQFVVRRSLRPNSATLRIDGERVGRTAKDIESTLEQQLGVSKRYIRDYVFVPQKEIDAWIDKRDTDRASDLNRLFGLQSAPVIYKGLFDYCRSVEIGDLQFEVSAAEDNWKSAVKSLEEAEASLSELGDVSSGDVDSTLANLQAIETALSDRRNAEFKLKEAKNVADNHRSRSDSIRAEISVLASRYDSLKDAATKAGSRLEELLAEQRDIERYTVFSTQSTNYRNQLIALFEFRATRPKLIDVDQTLLLDGDVLVAAKDCVSLLSTKETVLNDKLQSQLQMKNSGACVTCGRPFDVSDELIQDTRDQLEKVRSELEHLRYLLKLRADFDASVNVVQQWRFQFGSRLESLKQQRNNLRKLQVPASVRTVAEVTAEIEQARSCVSEFSDIQSDIDNKNRDLSLVLSMVSQCEENIARVMSEINEINKRIPDSIDDGSGSRVPTTYTNVSKRIRELYARRSEYAVRLSARDAAKNAVSRQSNMLQQLKDKQRLYTARSFAVDYLQNLRSIFHPTGLPRKITHAYLQALQSDINDTLGKFLAPFVVEISEDLSFLAVFPDGRRIMDRRLSVGQRVVLAFAIRVAMNLTFARTAGLLVLDEAQAYLDEQTIDAMPRVISKLKSVSTTQGLQILFVTHDPRLSFMFDNTIDLSDSNQAASVDGGTSNG